MSDLAQALLTAIRVHAGQVDRQGEPYLLHVLRVVEAVSDEAKVVAALHDVFEDGGDEGKRMVRALDLSGGERAVLHILTRNARVPYAEYISLVARRVGDQGKIAREVKTADLRDNLGRIPLQPSLIAGVEAREEWREKWKSLKQRYERALVSLEAGGKTP